jgi:oligopeptide/dipeptide ABC transporter ATP-binding protein
VLTTAEPAAGVPFFEVDELSVEFRHGNRIRRVVDEVSFQIGPGETLGLVGESGSGKSMTALAIMGLLGRLRFASSSGSVRLAGRELLGLSYRELSAVRGPELAMVFQDPMSSLNPALTIGHQLVETLRRHQKISRRAARERAVEMLKLAEIPAAERRVSAYSHEFSGGMRQRVMIALALCCQPKVLIADEPTTALDVTIQAQILDLLRGLQSEFGMAILFITHNLGVVADLCDRVAVMYSGQIVEKAPVLHLFEDLAHPYTESLLRSTTGRPGAVRNPAAEAIEHGCRFADRCRYAQEDLCGQEIPLLPRAGTVPHLVRCVRTETLELDTVRAVADDENKVGAGDV